MFVFSLYIRVYSLIYKFPTKREFTSNVKIRHWSFIGNRKHWNTVLTVKFSNNFRCHKGLELSGTQYTLLKTVGPRIELWGHRSRSISEKFGDVGVDALDRTCDRTRVVDSIFFILFMHFISTDLYLYLNIRARLSALTYCCKLKF